MVLFNLGGPDGPKAVRPFLFNLFRDPAIIPLPGPARIAIAALISSLRAKSARANYARMGGGSPLLPETRAQAAALTEALSDLGAGEVRVFPAMRYWKPTVEEVAKAVEAFAPDRVVLLPLYPQYSTTTTASSAEAQTRCITTPEAAAAIAGVADGCVVGSAIVKEIGAGKPVQDVLDFVAGLAAGAHSA